jgi:hypothetical protein
VEKQINSISHIIVSSRETANMREPNIDTGAHTGMQTQSTGRCKTGFKTTYPGMKPLADQSTRIMQIAESSSAVDEILIGEFKETSVRCHPVDFRIKARACKNFKAF